MKGIELTLTLEEKAAVQAALHTHLREWETYLHGQVASVRQDEADHINSLKSALRKLEEG